MSPLLLVVLLADAGVAAAVSPDGGPAPAKGPPPEVRLECAPNPVRIGDTLTCTLQAAHRDDVSVSVTAPAELVPEQRAPLADQAGEAQRGPTGKLITTRVFTQQVRTMKPLKVKGLTVVWREAEGGEGRLEVPAETIPVQSVLGTEAAPKWRTFDEPGEEAPVDFWSRRGPMAFLVTNWPLVIALGALLVVTVGVGVGVLVKRRLDARFVDTGPPVDPRPAHVIAYEKLDWLAAEQLPAAGLVMDYYVRLSEIVRDYLERRYHFGALEMTSEEIRAEVAVLGLSGDARLGVDDFLNETDLVKFADFAPSESEIDTVMRLARGLVAQTQVAEDASSAPARESTS